MNRHPREYSPPLEERREAAVEQLRRRLRKAIRDSNLTQRAVEESNGFTRGYLSQVLQGHVTLTARHLFGILFALGITPESFFHHIFTPEAERPDPAPMSEIRERMARYDAALKQLEDKGVLTPAEPLEPESDSEI